MRFMIIRKADKETEAGALPTTQLMTDMLNYNQELANAGMLLDGMGLQPTSKGFRVKFSSGKPKVTDGPFTEAKELIAGFTLVQAKSKEEVLEWVKRWPASDANGNAELEVRQVYEAEDFGPEFTPEMQAHEELLLKNISKK